MNEQDFRDILFLLANAWNNADIETALACFSSDCIYMQPPDAYIFKGRDQLKVVFSRLQREENFTWHSIWFDPKTQTGVGEFSYKIHEAHGIVTIELKNGKIKLWREYQWQGCLSWDEFISIEDKDFQLTINNFKREQT